MPVVASVLPAFIALAHIARRRLNYWLAALVGGGGWFLALMARGPLSTIMDVLGMYNRTTMALVSGPIEESVRFLVLRYFISGPTNKGYALVIGIGWGLAEAIMLFVAQVPIAASLGYSWVQLLPGALERNTAILLHTSMAALITLGIMGRVRLKYSILLAMIVHSTFNLAALHLVQLIGNPWLFEVVLLVISITIFMVVTKSFRRLHRIS